MFSTIGFFVKQGDPRVQQTLDSLIRCLGERGLRLLMDASCGHAYPGHGLSEVDSAELGKACDLVLSVGGDGTMLQAARRLVDHDVMLLGINLGRLGFLTDISPHALEETCLGQILAGEYQEEKRFLLNAEVFRGEERLCCAGALNDVVVHRWNTSHMVGFRTLIDGYFVSEQRSDGLIVATPTGSTAYALSGGGPLLHPALNVLVLVSICPHTLSNRPIVVDADSRVEIYINEGQPIEAQMTCDGVLCRKLLPGDHIRVSKHHQVRLLHPVVHDPYAVWRAKLNWGIDP